MGWFTDLTGFVAPFFIVMSPVLSYSDQAISMHRNKSSTGFSLDIPLIMLVASFLRIFYWPGARFDASLLAQAVLMVVMQMALLKIALDHRPAPSSKGGEAGLPFAGGVQDGLFQGQRPYNFWQWRSPKPFWQFLLYFVVGLAACELVLGLLPPVYALYSSLIGVMGLSIEATLPIPQILANAQVRSCKGLRLSVLASWLIGDALKMFWFFTTETEIPLVFKVCGMFQASCDCFLGVQYFMYGDGTTGGMLGGNLSSTLGSGFGAQWDKLGNLGSNFGVEKGELPVKQEEQHQMQDVSFQRGSPYGKPAGMRDHSRSLTPTRRPAPFHAQSSEAD